MILTVTPNPALDYSLRLDAVEIGRRAVYRESFLDPSGKGVNVSRMVRRLGGETLVLGFSAGETGSLLEAGLAREGVPQDLVRVPGRTRINVTLLTGPEGTATHLHGPGSGVGEADVERLLASIRARLPVAASLVLSGSFPPGMAPSAAGRIVRMAAEARVPSIVDVEGGPLVEALRGRPSVVKPNRREAERFLGRALASAEDVVRAARELVGSGAEAAILTLGGEGAVAADSSRAWRVRPPREEVVRAVGAGDSFAAGFALARARGADLPEALRFAAAAGAATALAAGTGLGRREDVERLLARVEVEAI